MINLFYAASLSFVICLMAGPVLITVLKKKHVGQSIRSDGPKSHLNKAGTPTMGGIIIIIAISIVVLTLVSDFTDAGWVLFAILGFGIIGFIDDLLIIVSRKSLGLKAREKLFVQIVLAGMLAFYIYSRAELGTQVVIPFTDRWYDLSFLYIPFAVIVIVGSSNAVNLTDGLDGLAAGTVAIAAGAFLYISLQSGNMELAIVSAAIIGSCLGFSWFNAYPAQVFMGDTGALALGAGLAALSLLLKAELSLLIVGGVFVMETLSVVIQVVIYKLTGRRLFRMSPLHHHFELGGWMETKVVTRFWIIGLLCGILGILGA